MESPLTIKERMLSFQEEIRNEITHGIVELLREHDGVIMTREDPYHGYPSVFDEDARCTISRLKGARINSYGQPVFLTGGENRIKQPHCEVLPISELLQVWDILLRETN